LVANDTDTPALRQGPVRPDTKAAVTLGMLNAIERDASITQRHLSGELGIALGMANAYLKRCVRKGLVKVRQAPLKRYAYYLTPSGFAEKSRLTIEYFKSSFEFFRDARRQCTALFEESARRGHTRVALVGASELAEAAILSAAETGVTIVAVIDAGYRGQQLAGVPVVAHVGSAGNLDALLVTDMRAPQAAFDSALIGVAALGLGPERVLAPALLPINAGPQRRARKARA
jgi:DNA-binding MarR family transcriptional regulator